MLNNKRKYFYTLIFFKVLFSKRNECIFKWKFMILLFIKFDNDKLFNFLSKKINLD